MIRLLLLALATVLACSAQPLALGVKAGMPINAFIDTDGLYKPALKPYTLGAQVELNLPRGWGVEFDLLYKRTGFDGPNSSGRTNSWEFPLLVKYKFGGGMVRPFISGGVNFRHLGDLSMLGTPVELLDFNQNGVGYTAGVGLRISLGIIKIWPEFRYTYWGTDPFRISGINSSVYTYLKNQGDILVGITF